MFTGIVEELGAVRALDGGRLVVGCPLVATDSTLGASVAVNGTCLTVVERTGDTLAFDLSGETLDRTALGSVRTGDPVNLERPVTLGGAARAATSSRGTSTASDGSPRSTASPTVARRSPSGSPRSSRRSSCRRGRSRSTA